MEYRWQVIAPGSSWMKKRRSLATLSDVARTAGVGVGTASRVLNGGINVSPKTLKRVEAAIERLGYLPNHAARVLKGGRTRIVGLLVPSIADSFFARCAESAERVARRYDSLLIVAVINNERGAEINSLNILMSHRPDGLLIVPSDFANEEFARFVGNSTVPIVTLDRPLFGSGCASVITDNFDAARKATHHLIGHGYQRILCFGREPKLYTIQERVRGYRQAMKEAGLSPLVDTSLSADGSSAPRSLAAHLNSFRPPRAIFTLKNSSTVAALQALQLLKVAVPSRVALLGFDDFELAGTLRPSISVVQQPMEEVGQKAAEILFAQLEHARGFRRSSGLSPEPVVLENRLVLRKSCGCRSSRGEISQASST
jgi:LacI family transcriptional regulator